MMENITSVGRQYESDYDRLLHACWRIQDCGSCLRSDFPCGWCPYSQTCIPNPAGKAIFPIFTPIFNPDICPHWAERWELRAKPTMCYISTLNLISCLISIASTLFVVLVICLLVSLIRCIKRRRRQRREKLAGQKQQNQPQAQAEGSGNSAGALAAAAAAAAVGAVGDSSNPQSRRFSTVDERSSLLGPSSSSRARSRNRPVVDVGRRTSFWSYIKRDTQPVYPEPREVIRDDVSEGSSRMLAGGSNSNWKEERNKLLGAGRNT